MDVNYELYKVFHEVAQAGSFSKGAVRLHITQSAVSQAIKNLEGQLGVPLFFRGRRQVSLTSEGRLLLAHLDQALNYLKRAENKILEIRNLEAGQLHIGASDTVCRYFLLPYLEAFNQQYPKVKLRLVNRTSAQLAELLKNGGIDFCLITLPVAQEGFQVNGCFTAEDIFVAGLKFKQLQGKRLDWRQLALHPLLLLEKSSSSRMHLDAFLEGRGVSLQPKIELESVDLLVQLARRGMGIAQVLKESVRSELQQKHLFEVRTKEKLPPRQLGIATLPHVPLSLAASKMIALLPRQGGRG